MKDDEFGNTIAFVFLGLAKYQDYYGSKSMSIHWKLEEPIPQYMGKEMAKMAVG